jgi:hypothetical protein
MPSWLRSSRQIPLETCLSELDSLRLPAEDADSSEAIPELRTVGPSFPAAAVVDPG